LQLQPISLHEICQHSLLFVREQAIKKQIQLIVQLDPEDLLIQADLTRLKQILANLLANAVKFTPANGAVMLEAGLDLSEQVVRFTVHDTGIGIAPEHLGRLFRPFSQIDSSLSRSYEGTGLGLALVHRLVELHGGSVSVHSVVGSGSRFSVCLPHDPHVVQAPVSGISPDVPVHNEPDPSTQPHNLLIVDDNASNVQVLSEYLQAHGYQVTIALDGYTALEQIAAAPPDLIVMDIQMPHLDGLSTIRQIRVQPNHAATPIIAVTARAMPGDAELCLEAGATNYLTKPVRLRTLLALIQQLLATVKPYVREAGRR
jgi:CheY-like chemotaxis protein